MKHYMNYLNR